MRLDCAWGSSDCCVSVPNSTITAAGPFPVASLAGRIHTRILSGLAHAKETARLDWLVGRMAAKCTGPLSCPCSYSPRFSIWPPQVAPLTHTSSRTRGWLPVWVISNPGLASLAPASRHLACLASLLCLSYPAGLFSLISLPWIVQPKACHWKKKTQYSRPADLDLRSVCECIPLSSPFLISPSCRLREFYPRICLSVCLPSLSRPAA